MKIGKIMPAAIVLMFVATALTALPAADSGDSEILGAAGEYNAGDIGVINGIIEDNGLNWITADPADGSYVPPNWTGVTWSGAPGGTDRRITNLSISMENLRGTADLSGLTALKYLDCYLNYSLRGLKLTGCVALEKLTVFNTKVSELDLTGLTNLIVVRCESNELTKLTVTGLTKLEELSCHSNQLTELDVSGLIKLEELYCSSNKLTALNVSGCTLLERLECYNNELTELDVSGLTSLKYLYCFKNKLTSLDVTGCPLVSLNCIANPLTKDSVKGVVNWDGKDFVIDKDPMDLSQLLMYMVIGVAILLVAILAFVVIFRRKDKRI
jgi:hypothetical protein